jgi:GNAT superfamily N-acetyltransferase
MTAMDKPHTLRAAREADLPAIVGLITELAVFEKLEHLVVVTPESLQPHLFGPRPAAEAVVAEVGGTVVAFALFFHNFSTFLGKPGLYLEDLYVQPAHRGTGLGRALLQHLAALAVARGCGATVMPDWRICRVTGPALQALGRG